MPALEYVKCALANELPMALPLGGVGGGACHDDVHYCEALQSSASTSDDTPLQQITPFELVDLLEWMVSNLGSEGLAIQVEQVTAFIESWKHLSTWKCEKV